MTARIGVVGGNGRTGRAVCARSGPGAASRSRSRRLADLAGALTGCDAVYVIALNLHPDEESDVAAAVLAAKRADGRRVVLHSRGDPRAGRPP